MNLYLKIIVIGLSLSKVVCQDRSFSFDKKDIKQPTSYNRTGKKAGQSCAIVTDCHYGLSCVYDKNDHTRHVCADLGFKGSKTGIHFHGLGVE